MNLLNLVTHFKYLPPNYNALRNIPKINSERELKTANFQDVRSYPEKT